MKIGFFEVEDWAREKIAQQFPTAVVTPDKLLPENAKKYADLEVVSPFIYSQLSSSTLLQMPQVKFIATRSTGFDHVDLSYCKNNNIVVSNVPPPCGGPPPAGPSFFFLLLFL